MMQVEHYMSSCNNIITNNKELEEDDDDDDVPLPGFRFHPTDEELVGFYLRRKVEKKPISIELIKQADIYKYDPWDLPKSTNVGEKDKEWYFFCKRGRKYKNSVRPNRVTGSGFWKATGIDRPIYSGRDCIGLKKSLVYYRGSAGKGTKTEWMMHEFRLPAKHMDAIAIYNAQEEAEVWTLCRILKRNVPYRKCDDWRGGLGANKKGSNYNILMKNPFVDAITSSETICSSTRHVESSTTDHHNYGQSSSSSNSNSSYISFSTSTSTAAPIMVLEQNNINNLYSSSSGRQASSKSNIQNESSSSGRHFISSLVPSDQDQARPPPASNSSFSNYNNYIYSDDVINELMIRHANWEDLRSVVDCAAAAATTTNSMY